METPSLQIHFSFICYHFSLFTCGTQIACIIVSIFYDSIATIKIPLLWQNITSPWPRSLEAARMGAIVLILDKYLNSTVVEVPSQNSEPESHDFETSRDLAVNRPSASLRWRQNGRDSVSNHQPHDCLFNRLFRRRSKKTSKLRVTGLCVGNSPRPVNSPHKGPVTRKMFPFDDIIM